MPAIYLHELQVPATDIDGQGHANNIAYFRWMQTAAVAHSDAQGWDTARYRASGWSWVVRSHSIEYRRPLFADDVVCIRTWVQDLKKYTSLRKYEILLAESNKLVARAETNWAFVELAAGRLIAIPEEVSSAFEIPHQAEVQRAMPHPGTDA